MGGWREDIHIIYSLGGWEIGRVEEYMEEGGKRDGRGTDGREMEGWKREAG